MAKSLIEELPRIASEGRQEAQRIIERLSSGTRIGLQTNELVLPRKDVSGFFRGQVPNIPNAFNAGKRFHDASRYTSKKYRSSFYS